MKKQLILPVLFFLLIFHCATPPEITGMTGFETKLARFRYSLYEELEDISVDDSHIFMEQIEKNKELKQKIVAFITANQKEIRKYQERKLSYYKDIKIDLTPFEHVKELSFFDFLKEFSSDLYRNYTMFKIDPMVPVYTIRSFILGQYLSSSLLGNFFSLSYFAGPIISSRETAPGIWEITMDEYYFVYRLKYNLATMDIINVEFYKRIDENPFYPKNVESDDIYFHF